MRAFPEFANSYWVIPGRFAAGEYPGARRAEEASAKVTQLLQAGIDLFIDLTETHELEPYQRILVDDAGERESRPAYLRMPICDMNVPTHAEMVAILNAIDGALAAGRRIYLHCWGGIGRTGTVVGCYLVRHGLSGDGALERVAALFATTPKSAFYQSPQTEAQCAFVREWIEAGSASGGDPRPDAVAT